MTFETSYDKIIEKINQIDPIAYSQNRNYVDGAVSYLSPYISRGVISTNLILDRLKARGFKMMEMGKFVQELAWRDYWQQVWIAKEDKINFDLKHQQPDVEHSKMSSAIIEANTGISIIDEHINLLETTGYIHNHMRMYVASIACNIGKSHWKVPAQWMYYHLLDGDWASNALSWQWVAGANANKKYYANQENINNFFHSDQKDTFLDVDYAEFEDFSTPQALSETRIPDLPTYLPKTNQLRIDPNLPTVIYNYYNLDPNWRKEDKANRILLLELEVFEQYPVSQKCIDFAIALAKNIPDMQYHTGSFDQLVNTYQLKDIFFKEHPLNKNYIGQEDSRDWMFEVTGYYPSFFAFWKKCKKEIKEWQGSTP